MNTQQFFLLLAVVAGGATVTEQDPVLDLVPTAFPPIEGYVLRYLAEYGNDTEACLRSQLYPRPPEDLQLCRSLRYAITESHAHESYNVTGVVVLIYPGEYAYGSVTISMTNFTNIVVRKVPGYTGEVVLYCEEYLDSGFNHFHFQHSSYILLKELVFTKCGPFSPGMEFKAVDHSHIDNCTYRDNLQTGLILYQVTDVLVTNALFHDNNSTGSYKYTGTLDPGDLFFAGGLAINLDGESKTLWNVTIRNCVFTRNHASASNSNDTRPSLYRPRGNGGGVLVSFNGSTKSLITIEDSEISDNTALHNAGGMYIAAVSNSASNTVILRNVTVQNNTCRGVGGGLFMVVFESDNGNVVIAENVNFTDNVAAVGGGGCAIHLQDDPVNQLMGLITNSGSFSSCSFVNNSSPQGGSAVSLLSNARVDKAVTTTNFTNCYFSGNRADTSALLSVRFPILLQGTTVITNNIGGGVSLLDARMDVKGSAWFENNTAVEGGAIAMEDDSLLHLHNGVHLTFINNCASHVGGAIAVQSPSVGIDVVLLMNTRCFMQYEANNLMATNDPSEWNVSLSFINNEAQQDGAAIYATDISRCTFTPSHLDDNTTNKRESSLFNLDPPFHFRDNKVRLVGVNRTNETIATAPSILNVTPMNRTSAPGELLEFNVSAMDQSGNWKQAIWNLEDDDNETATENGVQNFFVQSTYEYTVRGLNAEVYGNCSLGVSRSLNFSLLQVIAGDVATTTTVNISVTCCYPGYQYASDSVDKTCVFSQQTDAPILRPDRNNRYVYLQEEIYAEKRDNGRLATALMPATFQSCSRQGSLPGCLFKHDSPEEQCADNRTGFLCGKCPNGTGVDLTLIECRECSIRDAIIFTVIVVLLVIFCILVLIFNVGIPNSLRGCVFFIQVVGFVYHSSQDKALLWDLHLSRVFGFSFYLPLCPYPGYDALHTVSYGFLLTVIGILTIVLYVISARFVRPLSQRSCFDGIWLLSFFVYKYTADTCLNILRCEKVTIVEQQQNYSTVAEEYVFYYDGTVKCFESPHLGLAIFALIFGVVVIVLFPVLIFVISFRHFKHTQPFTDVLNKGLNMSRRWWSLFDILRRLLFIVVAFLFNYVEPTFTQLGLFGAGLLVFFITVWAKPYKDSSTNVFEAAILLDLLVLTGIFLNLEERKSSITQALSVSLLLFPFLAILGYIVFRTATYWWKRQSPTSFKTAFTRIKIKVAMRKPGGRRRKHKIGLSHLRVVESFDHGESELDANEHSFRADYSHYREEILEQEDTD